jgi:ribosomal-protein-alanine N-acetyltransferase
MSGIDFVPLPAEALELMLRDGLQEAGAVVGVELPAFFLEEKWLWQIRLDQLQETPEAAPWLVRAAVLREDGSVVGHAGFHGPPDGEGAVEVGYTVIPGRRGQGLSHRLLRALVDEATASPDVRVVRASISPDNLPSLAVARRAGMRHVGEQWDDEDGQELVFELDVSGAAEEDRQRRQRRQR